MTLRKIYKENYLDKFQLVKYMNREKIKILGANRDGLFSKGLEHI